MGLKDTYLKQFDLHYVYNVASMVESSIENGAPLDLSGIVSLATYQKKAIHFQKNSLLHLYIKQVFLFHYDFFFTLRDDELDGNLDTLETLQSQFEMYNIPVSFLELEYDDDDEENAYLITTNREAKAWYLRNKKKFQLLASRICPEVFYIVFSNRELLQEFNNKISWYFDSFHFGKEQLDANGKLKRVAIPMWARRAVFFRDKGICVNCSTDLKSIINLLNKENFDHIIPLAKGGVNDPTNLQLLCDHCNNRKGKRNSNAGKWYHNWW